VEGESGCSHIFGLFKELHSTLRALMEIRAPSPGHLSGLEGPGTGQVWKAPVRPVTHHRLRRDHSDIRELIVSIGFAVDEVFTPLQAADLLAHLTRQHLITGQMPVLLQRLATPGPGYILRFDGGELWDEAEIDKNWNEIQAAKDMPSKI